MSTARSSLHELARLYGVQTAYYNGLHQSRTASKDVLLSVLKALGAPLEKPADVYSALRERRKELWRNIIEPVTVAWEGNLFPLSLRIPSSLKQAALTCRLTTEDGQSKERSCLVSDLNTLEMREVEGTKYEVKRLHLEGALPPGYHRLSLQVKEKTAETLIISTPIMFYRSSETEPYRKWGVFVPLYALNGENGWGSGDLSKLQALVSWVGEMGGNIVGILPLLATFLDNTTDPSPYTPASRLLWNEFYLDIARVPELETCQGAQSLLTSVPFQEEIKTLRSATQVDYHRIMIKKRQVLEELCQHLFATSSKRQEALLRFVKANPVIEDYARFRAARERHGPSWQAWPSTLADGAIKEVDYDEATKRYYIYTQWLIHEQMEGLFKTAQSGNVKMYLDLPLGIHPNGYDVWREHDVFFPGISAGAPPDAVFTKGQNWGFPPLHPGRIREQGYRYFIAYLRHHLKFAGVLRLDHVMGLHRLFCIPEGIPASEGTYVRYHPEDFYAILSLESHRNRTIIVGEDLGTVPRYIRPAMKKHGMYRMYVMHYELAAGLGRNLKPVPSDSIASMNTHDMFPFAAVWDGTDIEQMTALGFLDRAAAKLERKLWENRKRALVRLLQVKGFLDKTPAITEEVMKACLAFLSDSDARMVLVNLEDLWLETRPQNIPSTTDEVYPNWRHKARYRLDELCQMPQVVATLHIVNRIRRGGKPPQ